MESLDRRERERQEKRALILSAAMKLFLEESFDKTTMRRIAEAIEYTPGALYSYFKDKDDILYALHQRGFELLIDMMQASVTSSSDPVVSLRRLGEVYLEFAFAQPQYYDLMFIARSTGRTIAARAAWEPGERAYHLLLAGVKACLAKGKFAGNPSPETIALAMWGTVHGLASLALRNRLIGVPEAERQRAIFGAFRWMNAQAPRDEPPVG